MISVVISCYNGEKKLNRMLDSLVSQSDKNSQIIIVNDGSTDKSPEIIKSYSNILSFQYIDSPNMGVSHARNLGMSFVKGEYVTFFDCDDKIEIDTIKQLSDVVKSQKDLYLFNYQKNDEIIAGDLTSIRSFEDLYRTIIEDTTIKGYIWNKLFRADIISENNLSFNEKINFCEDLLFVCEYLKNITSFEIVNYPFYHYYTNEGSVTKEAFSISKLTAMDALELCIEQITCDRSKPVFEEYYYRMLLSLSMNGYEYIMNDTNLHSKFKKNLYRYPINTISNVKLKFSIIIARRSFGLVHFVWKLLRRSEV